MSDVCNPDSCSTIGVLQLKIDRLMQIIDSQKETNIALVSKVMDDHKFAELGRLAIEVFNKNDGTEDTEICVSSYWQSYMGGDDVCSTTRCMWQNFCQKRAELLAEVQSNG